MIDFERVNASHVDRITEVNWSESQSFRLIDKPNPELYALEPEDMHMFMKY